MSAPATPTKPSKVPKPPPPPKVVAPPVEDEEDDLPPPPEDDPEEEIQAPVVTPPPKPIIVAKPPSVSPPPPPKAAKAAPLTPPPVLTETIESSVDRKGVKSFINPALAGKANSVPKPPRTASPTPPPRVSSAPSAASETESADTEEEPAKRGSIFTSVSHGLRKALRNSLITAGVDSSASPAPPIDENILKEGMLSKMNREGKFEKYKVVLRKDEFFYTHDKDATGGNLDEDGDGATGAATTTSSSSAGEHDRHEIPLVQMIVL